MNSLVSSCQGLSLERIRRVLSKIIATYKEINIESLELIFAEKRQIISKTQILEFYPAQEKISDIGGLNNLKLWLKTKIRSFVKEGNRVWSSISKRIIISRRSRDWEISNGESNSK